MSSESNLLLVQSHRPNYALCRLLSFFSVGYRGENRFFKTFEFFFLNSGLGLEIGLRAQVIFALIFHDPAPELPKRGQKAVILELGVWVWPISKKLTGPYE